MLVRLVADIHIRAQEKALFLFQQNALSVDEQIEVPADDIVQAEGGSYLA